MPEEEKETVEQLKSPEELRMEKFLEARRDTAEITKRREGWRSRAYGSPSTIGYGNTRHPNGCKVCRGNVIGNSPAIKEKYFNAAYMELFTPISENLNMEKMSHNQLVAVNDLIYNRGPGCLTKNNGILAESMNAYFENPTVENGIMVSLHMTAKNDNSGKLSGLIERRDEERRLFFGEQAEEVINATKAMQKVKWNSLENQDLKSLINLVAETGPACITGENAELPKVIELYTKNPTSENKQKFTEEIKRSKDIKFIQRPAEKEDIHITDIKELPLIMNLGIRAQESDDAFRVALGEKEDQESEKMHENNKDEEVKSAENNDSTSEKIPATLLHNRGISR